MGKRGNENGRGWKETERERKTKGRYEGNTGHEIRGGGGEEEEGRR